MARGAEIVIALVCPLGTDVETVVDEMKTELTEYGFTSSVHRLSDYIIEFGEAEDFNALPFDERLDAAMTAGDDLRKEWGTGDALALCAISDISAWREANADVQIESPSDRENALPGGIERHAYILRSLKTQDEVDTLRTVYGSRFVLIGIYAPDEIREEYLRGQIRKSRNNNDESTWSHSPADLIERDWAEQAAGGQDVLGTFHQADFFVDAADAEVSRTSLVRALAVLFGDPFRTPTRDEYGQFAAQGAAMRSAELGRQVGAAICSGDGAVISLGTNEVPKYGGGAHWDEDDPEDDHREFRFGERDTNRVYQDRIADDVVARARKRLLDAAETTDDPEGTIKEMIDALTSVFRGSFGKGTLREVTEYGRAVHAEMDALLDAARRGVPVRGATLYVTAFPCHTCARHIIAAGIERVVYVSPYAKSKAQELHPHDIDVAGNVAGDQVKFEPFVGVAPRRYLVAFDAAARERLGHCRRKDESGRVQSFDKQAAQPVVPDREPEHLRPLVPTYRFRELLALNYYDEKRGSTDASDEGATNESEE